MAAPTGGSLVSNILKKAATLDDIYLEESIAKVEKKSHDLREEILQYMKQNYEEFTVQADTTITIEQKIKDLANEFQRLNARVVGEGDLKGRLVKSAGKKEEIEKQVKETEGRIKLVERLVQVHKNLEQIKLDVSRKRYKAASIAVEKTTKVLKLIGSDAKVCLALKDQLALVKSDICCQLQEEWNARVQWKPYAPTQELNLEAAVDIKHTVPDGSFPDFEEIIESMDHVFAEKERESRAKRYATKLLNSFIKPLLKHNCLEVTVTTVDHSSEIRLKDIGTKRSLNSCVSSIIRLLTAVHDMIPQSQSSQWMEMLGQSIEPDFTPLFLKHVLSERIPKTGAERAEFLNTSTLVTKLEKALISLHLVSESYSALTDYTTNVDTHIAVQQCHDILSDARKLLLLPLHETIKTTDEETLVPLQKLNIGGKFVTGEHQLRLTGCPEELDISLLTFAFPPCLISVSIKQLVTLLHDTLVRCTKSTDSMAIQLYHTARDIVELFIAVSNAYHQKTVSSIPRNAMIQHNNYMYVAHNLLTIGHQFHSHIKCLENVSFIDYVPRLRKLGEECFLSEMERQTSSILECLDSFETFDEVSDRQEELERSIRQAVLTIFNLGKVYSETLHSELSQRCQGGLLNVLITELISRTLTLVDISSADATALNEAFDAEVIRKSPIALSLTADEEQLSKICQNWERMKELIFVLGASQNDIVNRWSGGKGSLAKQFSVAEVKQLIRAIFKNTERRAVTLTKIV